MSRRVCLLTSTFPRWPGDAVTPFMQHLVQDLVARGWRVEVLAPHDAGAARREVMFGAQVRRFRYAWPPSAQTLCYRGGALINLREDRRNLLALPGFVGSQLLSLARGLRGVALIHAHWILPQGFSAGLLGPRLGVPVITTVHGGSLFGLRAMAGFKRRALGWADTVTVNSSVTEAAIRSLAPGLRDVRRIHIGASDGGRPPAAEVQATRARLLDGGSELLVFVGRMVEEKGAGDLLRALPTILAERPGVRAVLAGAGQHMERFRALAGALGVAGAVRFPGWVDGARVPALMAAGDIFVGPSKRGEDGWVEAQGITFAEAMFAGTPVVATRSGGIVDAVIDGETGLLVDEADPQGIAAAVLRLLADPAEGAALAARAAVHARAHFTRSATADRFSALYEERITERRLG